MIEKHMLSQLSHTCRAARQQHTLTHTILLEEVSSLFCCLLLVIFLLVPSLLTTLGSARVEGRDMAMLVPVQVHTVSIKRSKLVQICFAGFLFWIKKQ